MKAPIRFSLAIFLFLLVITSSKAQYVVIPDANFKTYLETTYPNCMSGGMLDTTCTAVVAATVLDLTSKNIANLTGIQFFDKLTSLDCKNNKLSSLPALPSSLIFLGCSNNQLSSLPDLPFFLTQLTCNDNQLSSLPLLPTSLKTLFCFANQLTSLPALPSSLTNLSCSNNQLINLPALPSSLNYLYCDYNKLSNLPSLPPSIWYLYCNNNLLSSLPTLPSSLTNFNCYHNQLSSIPALPSTLQSLECNDNQLTSLPSLPSSLRALWCSFNKLTGLSVLPSSLLSLRCNDNQISSLPILPSSLTELWCYKNQLTSLPTLPTSLEDLQCNNNQINSLSSLPSSLITLICHSNPLRNLPLLPPSITILFCYNNQLSSLPILPPFLQYLYCYNNQLKCLPFLPNTLRKLQATGNSLVCLPNIPTYLTFTSDIGYAICDAFNNLSGCTIYSLITGKAFVDANANDLQDSGENGFGSAKIEIQPGNYILTADSSGFYSINLDTGTYSIKAYDANSYYSIFPTTHVASFTGYGQIDSLNNFAMQPLNNINDLQIILIPLGRIRPGRETGYTITYKNVGTTTLSGNVQLDYDNILNFNSSNPAFATQTSNMLSWNYTDLIPGEAKKINVYFTPPSSTVNGTNLNFTATVNPEGGDNTPLDNEDLLVHTVATSYDPNFKEVLPAGDITPAQVFSQDPFTYIVHFQNTGNDTAFVINIRDTISANFEIQKIETMAASHDYTFKMKNGAAIWTFDNILLPDSTINERLSHGFVKYRINPKNTLLVNDQIKNTANIYFDFNAPVKTNTTINKVAAATGTKYRINENRLELYPNPSKGIVIINYGIKEQAQLKIMSVDGRVIYNNEDADLSNFNIDLNGVQKGIYFIQIISGELMTTRKLVLN